MLRSNRAAVMVDKHVTARDLQDKIIDCHSHIGISLKAFSCMEYPYAQSLEGLYYRQKAAGVDVNIVFPLSASLFFDPACFTSGELRPAEHPLSETPYKVENEMVCGLSNGDFHPYYSQRLVVGTCHFYHMCFFSQRFLGHVITQLRFRTRNRRRA